MKNRTTLVTALSIVGVLLAGATAAAANFGILSTTSEPALGTADPTVAVAPVETAIESSPAIAQPELLAFEIPQVGVITVARSGDELSAYQVDAPGWQWLIAADGSELVVRLTDGTRLMEFSASVVDGRVAVNVAEASISNQVAGDDDHFESDDHEGGSDNDD